MTFAERMAEDRRLVILRLLHDSPRYSTNESVIAIALRDFGHGVSRDQARTDFAWLTENGLITVEDLSTVLIATLTQRGVETVLGIVTTPGVKRPSPRS